MAIRLINVLLLWICFFPAQSFASVKTPFSDCDTIITTAGQVLLVKLAESPNESNVRFTYCGDSEQKVFELRRSNIREIRKAFVRQQQLPEGSEPVALQDSLPEGSEPVILQNSLPEGSEPIPLKITKNAAAEKRKITGWAKWSAIGGFGSYFMVLFSQAFNPLFILLVLPLFIIGLVFSLKVLRRTKNKPDLKKQRTLASLSLGATFGWLALLVLYIIIVIIFLFIFLI